MESRIEEFKLNELKKGELITKHKIFNKKESLKELLQKLQLSLGKKEKMNGQAIKRKV